MKPNRILLMMLSMVLSINVTVLDAQEKGGCDLCGPASGSTQNVATGNYSATIGVACEATGTYSFASGFYAKANSSSTLALGKFVRARATNAMVIGTGSSNVDSKTLTNNIPNSLMVGFSSSVPTLFVSNSSGFNTTGKIGIGCVTSPQSKLHIRSDANEDAGIILEPTNKTNKAYFQIYDVNHKISVEKDKGLSLISQNDKISLDANNIAMNAKVSINTSDRFADGYEYALAVSGGILTTGVLVKEVTEWYDFVFDDDFELKSISDLEIFIDNNGHLPDIPSEDEIIEKGYDMVEMDGLLLKKIEELTLYTIELNKLIAEQQKIIEELRSK